MTVRHGYTDSIVSPDLGRMTTEQLALFITRDTSSPSSSASSVEHSPAVQAELELISKAAESQVVYVLGKEEMKIKPGTNIVRRVLLMAFLWLRDNTRTKVADMNIPSDMLVEVGFIKEI